MKLGVHVIAFTLPDGPATIGPTLGAIGEAAERAGLVSLSVMDHYFQMEMAGGPEQPMLEAYTTLGFLAARTEAITLRALVTGVTYRHPGLLAKIVTTLDVLSGGRASLGIGAAWYEEEHRGLGVPFPPLAERFERLEETIQIVLQMWSGEVAPYDGTYYQLAETYNVPPALSKPHPPIMIGGGGERKTLRLVARYADACNLFAGGEGGPAEMRRKLDALERHCASEGRDYDRITKTALWVGPLFPDAAGGRAFAEALSPYAEMGFTEVQVMTGGPDPAAFVDALGEHVAGPLSALD